MNTLPSITTIHVLTYLFVTITTTATITNSLTIPTPIFSVNSQNTAGEVSTSFGGRDTFYGSIITIRPSDRRTAIQKQNDVTLTGLCLNVNVSDNRPLRVEVSFRSYSDDGGAFVKDENDENKWIMIANDTINGVGRGNPSGPIRFDEGLGVVLNDNETVSLLVKLSEKVLFHSKVDEMTLGDVFVEDDYISMGVGKAVTSKQDGLNEVVEGWMWNGILHYERSVTLGASLVSTAAGQGQDDESNWPQKLPNVLDGTGENSSISNVFDVKALENILISSMGIRPLAGMGGGSNKLSVEVWTKRGSYREGDSWVMISKRDMSSAIASAGMEVDDLGVTVWAGQTQAFLVCISGAHTHLTSLLTAADATSSQPVQSPDWAVIRSGSVSSLGKQQNLESHRIWDGSLGYSIKSSADCTETRTKFMGFLPTRFNGKGVGYGNMFDVVALKTIIVHSVAIHVANVDHFYYEVWTRPGTLQGSEELATGWTLIASGSLEGSGSNRATILPFKYFTSVKIDQGQTRAFYITSDKPDLVYSAEGTGVGNTMARNNDFELREGNVMSKKAFGHVVKELVVWNGAVYYDILDDALHICDDKDTNTLTAPPVAAPVAPSITPLSPTVPASIPSSNTNTPSAPPTTYMKATAIVFRFEADNNEISPTVIDRIQSMHAMTLNQLLARKVDLIKLVWNHEVSIESIISSLITDGSVSCRTSSLIDCSVVQTKVLVNYASSITESEVRRSFLKCASNLALASSVDLTLQGPAVITCQKTIELQGMRRLKPDKQLRLEGLIKEFLNDVWIKETVDISVLSVSAKALNGVDDNDTERHTIMNGDRRRRHALRFPFGHLRRLKQLIPRILSTALLVEATIEAEADVGTDLTKQVEYTFEYHHNQFYESVLEQKGFEHVEYVKRNPMPKNDDKNDKDKKEKAPTMTSDLDLGGAVQAVPGKTDNSNPEAVNATNPDDDDIEKNDSITLIIIISSSVGGTIVLGMFILTIYKVACQKKKVNPRRVSKSSNHTADTHDSNNDDKQYIKHDPPNKTMTHLDSRQKPPQKRNNLDRGGIISRSMRDLIQQQGGITRSIRDLMMRRSSGHEYNTRRSMDRSVATTACNSERRNSDCILDDRTRRQLQALADEDDYDDYPNDVETAPKRERRSANPNNERNRPSNDRRRASLTSMNARQMISGSMRHLVDKTRNGFSRESASKHDTRRSFDGPRAPQRMDHDVDNGSYYDDEY